MSGVRGGEAIASSCVDQVEEAHGFQVNRERAQLGEEGEFRHRRAASVRATRRCGSFRLRLRRKRS